MPRIYPDWAGSFLNSNNLNKLKQEKLKVDVLITRPIPFVPLTISTCIALALYSSEKFWLKNFHTHLPRYFSFRAEYIDLTESII